MLRSGLASLLLLVTIGCWYGFAGGGLPSHIKTVAVLPFDNETPAPELQRELFNALRRELERRLSLRDAAENRANAVVRGTIRRYDTDVPIGYSARPSEATTARRKLQITVDIEIMDQSTGKALWERKGLVAEGEYGEGAERDGRRQALEKLVNDIVEGAQSQW
jgi:Lipopolysaccharide-assembly